MKVDLKENRSSFITLFRKKGCMAGIGVIVLLSGVVLFGIYFFLVKPNVRDLIAASMHGDVPEINRCLSGGVDINGRERWGWYRDNEGRPPLTAAVQSGSISTIALLIRAGADVNFPDGFGEPPACDAARRGDVEIIRLLAAAGADFSVVCNGKSLMEIAAEAGHTRAAEEIRRILGQTRSRTPRANALA